MKTFQELHRMCNNTYHTCGWVGNHRCTYAPGTKPKHSSCGVSRTTIETNLLTVFVFPVPVPYVVRLDFVYVLLQALLLQLPERKNCLDFVYVLLQALLLQLPEREKSEDDRRLDFYHSFGTCAERPRAHHAHHRLEGS